jgi:hypothetical protein
VNRTGISLGAVVFLVLAALQADRMHRSIKDLEARVATLEAAQIRIGDPEIPACTITVPRASVDWETLNGMGAWRWPAACAEAWRENRRLERETWDAERG